MTTQNVQNKNQATVLNDADLEQIAGGKARPIHFSSNDTYYAWNGNDAYYGWSDEHQFLCPNCKRPVHKGTWGRWYCDPCDASWYSEESLLPDTANYNWKQITRHEYLVAIGASL